MQADKAVPYGTVVEVMGHIKAVGIEKLGVIAEQPDEAAPKGGKRLRTKIGLLYAPGLIRSFILPARSHIFADMVSGPAGRPSNWIRLRS